MKTNYRASAKAYDFSGFHSGAKKSSEAVRKLNAIPVISFYPGTLSVIKEDYYTCNFGFFCKKELQFEKATKIPLRFRLGSLQYNDYLEQKPNAISTLR